MIDRFLELLVRATARIPTHYFQLPTAGGAEAIYRERVYCYELYHQLRNLLDEADALAHYALSGEIEKQGHAIIRRSAPDLVFHRPGDMDNLVVVEVKPVNASNRGIRKDVQNLVYFTSEDVGYRLGVELVYGDDATRFARFESRFHTQDLHRMRLFWHRRSGEPATRVL